METTHSRAPTARKRAEPCQNDRPCKRRNWIEEEFCAPHESPSGHFSDIGLPVRDVCCWGRSGHRNGRSPLPILTRSGHWLDPPAVTSLPKCASLSRSTPKTL